jgi:hypothetical protein
LVAGADSHLGRTRSLAVAVALAVEALLAIIAADVTFGRPS